MLTYHMFSEPGGRSENEDCVGVYQREDRKAFLLADGLGGHGFGQQASKLAVKAGEDWLGSQKWQGIESYLKNVFEDSHLKLKEMQEESGKNFGMRTTLNVFVTEGETAGFAHIGDSRIYIFQRGKPVIRTKDHSVPQMLALSGEIAEEEIRFHPDRNRLLRCLGDRGNRVKYEINGPFQLKKGMSILLCSDGFWEKVTEKQMMTDLRWARSVEGWLARMKKRVKKSEKSDSEQDNYSAVGIWIR